MIETAVSVFWFRRDLRLEDNAGLYYALRSKHPVVPLFIFDTDILGRLEDKKDRRVHFIHDRIAFLKGQLQDLGSDLLVYHGKPDDVWLRIMSRLNLKAVYANHDYEPGTIARDERVQEKLWSAGIPFHTYKDQCIFEKEEIVKDDGKPYTVFTPYSKKWKARLSDFYMQSYPSERYTEGFWQAPEKQAICSLDSIGFEHTDTVFPALTVSSDLLKKYEQQRDIPGVAGTSRLGVHLRFGTISIREKVREAQNVSEVFLNELIWREFYMMILWHFPHVCGQAFRKEYDSISWRNSEEEFFRWCEGKTGYPMVDAGMRELKATGYMHNRSRMLTASFLAKHLLIDWRWGEAWFARHLLDFDLSANNGGWQWAAGCGTDAAPYFRIFNPSLQQQKFDPDGKYIRQWVPEWQTSSYPLPVIDHETARTRCLHAYRKALLS